MNTAELSPDFHLQLWSSLVLLRPLMPSADRWLDEHIAHNDEVRWFDRALALDLRSAEFLVRGIRRDGLEVQS